MHLGEELVVLGVLLLLAYVLGRLAKLIGLPTIPIYMLVGLLASPHVGWFPLDFHSDKIELIAIFGLILLLFNLGLEFDQDEFFGNVGRLVLSGGSYIAINMVVGLAFGFWLGWGSREALIVAGITATSSSAIVTKLLIELGRLANRETPMILGVTVVEDIFIAIYLAIVSVVLSGETDPLPVVGKLGVAFLFLIVMFTIARWGGKYVSRLMRTKDDELFTVLFFGLAVLFAGIGEILGVTDAIGAFLIGLVCGATRFRNRIETFALPMRDVFAAFFFLNFGLSLNPGTFPEVVWPVAGAVLMTIVLNAGAGQFVAWINKLGPQAGINASAILHNRGEFALILATLSLGAGLDDRIQPFAGLYVLVMAVIGPLLAANSTRIGGVLLRSRKLPAKAGRDGEVEPRDIIAPRGAEGIALMEAALAGDVSDEHDADGVGSDDEADGIESGGDARPGVREPETAAAQNDPYDDYGEFLPDDEPVFDAAAEQAGQQSDQRATRQPDPVRQRDPEY
ncbi:potassium/proton antiporter membrane subunit (CPA2 family) [Frondihabitans sp. PhB188]|uniref:cation:proton antiporter n=1 Tax=Frondihabitans sp. PhB188 TaxID=2485200 RepID=UPI000F4A7721|nr:cation:proton antiporter [Frondihabitans sp. PhB188]ROQ37458.1 potassium/proton antiporter membrane subunit (CPA2 family) [Frondihabitans sp. PhB188]